MINISGAQLDLWIASVLWPFVRIMAMLATAPIFDNRAINRRVRIGLAGMTALLLSASLPAPPPLSAPEAPLLLLQQILIGVSMGFSMRLVFAAFEMAGDLLGLQMGLAFAQFIDPSKGSQSPLIGSFLGLLATLAFLSMDGHLMILATLVKTFEVVPISSNLGVVNFQSIVLAGSLMFMLSLQIALPVLAALVVCNVVLGVLARAAPQLNVMSIGFAITIGVGLWVLWASLPYFIYGLDGAISRMMTLDVLRSPGQ